MGTPNIDNLVRKVRDAGVVGAGGAGFPTYKKIDTAADVVIANGAECEPLLCKDRLLMENRPAEIVDGLVSVMRHVGATKGIVAVKAKNRTAIDSLATHLPHDITIFEMEDVYPAGDEYEVVFHAAGRRIPAGGYPSDIGIVVQNVETLYNIHRAILGRPVTHSMMTVHGHVKHPLTAAFPIGVSYGDVLNFAGGATIDDFVLIDGGPMMGAVTTDLSTPVTRISSGITVVARESPLAARKSRTERDLERIGKSACDQCCLCTEMCPRYLLGYPVQPHLVMRSLLVSGAMSATLSHWAQACSECNICTLWACPEGLDPKAVCAATKRELRERQRWLASEELQRLTKDAHRLKQYRSVPTTRLVRRLGLDEFAEDAPFMSYEIEPESVAVPLLQHAGAPAIPVVAVGDEVAAGDQIARPDESALSVPIHTGIGGTVRSIDNEIVIER